MDPFQRGIVVRSFLIYRSGQNPREYSNNNNHNNNKRSVDQKETKTQRWRCDGGFRKMKRQRLHLILQDDANISTLAIFLQHNWLVYESFTLVTCVCVYVYVCVCGGAWLHAKYTAHAQCVSSVRALSLESVTKAAGKTANRLPRESLNHRKD